ncbi:hypothetical protein GCM10028825_54520 [Spirosoma agri]
MIRGLVKLLPSGQKLVSAAHRMVICIPSGITEVEKRAVKDSCEHAGAKEIYMVSKPLAAAVDIGIGITRHNGAMIIDIGRRTTEIAVIALSSIVCEQFIHIAGDVFTRDIVDYMRRKHNLLIEERSGEEIKMHISSASLELVSPPADYGIWGRDLMTGIPKEIKVTYEEVAYCLDRSIAKIEEATLKVLELAPRIISRHSHQ